MKNYVNDGFCNIWVTVIDLTKAEENQEILKLHPELKEVKETTAFLLYPKESYLPTLIWKEKFSDKIIPILMKSPLIKEVMNKLLKGVATVWVFVDSGNKVEDDKSYKMLQETLKELSKEFELPEGVIDTAGNITGDLKVQRIMKDPDPDNFLKSGIPFKIQFTIKRLTLDKKEPLLRRILINIDPRLEEYKNMPMAFAFFGRGRFLTPMIGEEIDKENIENVTSYLCGACSCQVKHQNPGIDILSNIDWDSYLDGSEIVVDKELPPLIGTGDLIEKRKESSTPLEVIVEKNLSRNLLLPYITNYSSLF